jgi:hypothetical protein
MSSNPWEQKLVVCALETAGSERTGPKVYLDIIRSRIIPNPNLLLFPNQNVSTCKMSSSQNQVPVFKKTGFVHLLLINDRLRKRERNVRLWYLLLNILCSYGHSIALNANTLFPEESDLWPYNVVIKSIVCSLLALIWSLFNSKVWEKIVAMWPMWLMRGWCMGSILIWGPSQAPSWPLPGEWTWTPFPDHCLRCWCTAGCSRYMAG